MSDPPGESTEPTRASAQTVGRWLLAGFMAFAGVGHFAAPEAFLAQVPEWLPLRLPIVYASGAVEIGFAVALVALPRKRVAIGWALAAFFVVVFPGNVNQALTGEPAFGLETESGRWIRLLFQPVLVAWALWSTGAWRAWRSRARAGRVTGRP